ncbi:hypothetical protein VitviT2T_015830 [Vitis vinifera]|uniref:Uncharacterized protein n=1 Tax=Vitis vinifera TaxID=29760 RepID=A0ABY9CRH1_VITVI|nr:hypothetical protein VitviT2T_015830 [Vitis vinifera]
MLLEYWKMQLSSGGNRGVNPLAKQRQLETLLWRSKFRSCLGLFRFERGEERKEEVLVRVKLVTRPFWSYNRKVDAPIFSLDG